MKIPETTRTPVLSSLLSSVGYSPQATLDLEFRSGATYRYFAVPAAVVEGLLAAPSKGAFFNRNIRNQYRHLRLS